MFKNFLLFFHVMRHIFCSVENALFFLNEFWNNLDKQIDYFFDRVIVEIIILKCSFFQSALSLTLSGSVESCIVLSLMCVNFASII